MAVCYFVMTVAIILLNIDQIPAVFSRIFQDVYKRQGCLCPLRRDTAGFRRVVFLCVGLRRAGSGGKCSSDPADRIYACLLYTSRCV